jgi:23S rRNA (pseudouridine1915-N3)-methyltransferase
MNIRILMLGKNKDDYLDQAIVDFLKRLRPFCHLEMVYIKDERVHEDVAKILKIEAERLREHLKSNEWVIVLDDKGKSFTTEKLSWQFSEWHDRGTNNFVIIIGSAHGLAEELKKKANLLLSLSPLTMNHQIVRLVLLEQLYRIFTLKRGMKYHK